MSLNFKWSFLWVIAVCVTLVLSSPIDGTNAQRLARGLPPNPPKFLRAVPPTPVISASVRRPSPSPHRPSPSPKPKHPVTLTRRLEVRSDTGDSLGHVGNLETGGTISGINLLGAGKDLLVKLTYSPSHPTEFDISATNHGAGAFSTASAPILIAGVKESTPNSALWTIDPDTHELKAQTDGTVLAYDTHKNSLFLVSDIDEYNAKNGSPASVVNIYLVPV